MQGTTRSPVTNVTDAFLRAAYFCLPDNEYCPGWNGTPGSYAAIGLLLGAHYIEDQNGTKWHWTWLII